MGRLAEFRAAVGRLFTATDGRDILQNTPDGWEIDQPWLWWDGPADSDGTGGPWGNPPPGADMPYAMKGSTIPAMARCRSLICDVLAGVPWKVYRGREQLPTPSWIADPQGLNGDGRRGSSVTPVSLSAVEFWSQALVSAVELGEAVLYSPFVGETDEAGNIIAWGSRGMFSLNPLEVKREQGEWVVNQEVIPDSDLLFIRNRVWPGKYRGLGVWQQFGKEIGFAENVRGYGSGLLGRGIPAGYLKVTAPDLEQGEADRLKERWMAAHGGSQRRIAVLNATTDFKPLEISPEAVQLAELLKLSAWEVALIYGVPPYKLGISMGYSNTYANIESASIDYVQDALLPWARRIESAIDSKLAHGTSLKLDLDGLQRADTAARFSAYEIALRNEIMTVEEIRTLEDLPPKVAPTAPLQVVPEEEATA
jgi:HK97 family phage portal protein